MSELYTLACLGLTFGIGSFAGLMLVIWQFGLRLKDLESDVKILMEEVAK